MALTCTGGASRPSFDRDDAHILRDDPSNVRLRSPTSLDPFRTLVLRQRRKTKLFRRSVFTRGLAVLVAVGTVFASSVAGAASEKARSVPEAKIIYRGPHDVAYAAPDAPVDKKAFQAEFKRRQQDNTLDGDFQTQAYRGLAGSNRLYITPRGAPGHYIEVEFGEGVLSYGGRVEIRNGESSTAWLGGNPFNADTVWLTDAITVRGLNLSVSIGGGGWSVTGSSVDKTITWTGSVNNNWRIRHEYHGITFHGTGVWVGHNASGRFKFGSSYYTVGASDSSWL